jgi:hypothetical protein
MGYASQLKYSMTGMTNCGLHDPQKALRILELQD